MDEPLLPKPDPVTVLQDTYDTLRPAGLSDVKPSSQPFPTRVLLFYALPTLLAFLSLATLSSFSLILAIFGLGFMVTSGLAAAVLFVVAYCVRVKREALMESSHATTLCLLGGISEAILWSFLGIMTSTLVFATILSVSLVPQLVLIMMTSAQPLSVHQGQYIAAGVGLCQSVIALMGCEMNIGWVVLSM